MHFGKCFEVRMQLLTVFLVDKKKLQKDILIDVFAWFAFKSVAQYLPSFSVGKHLISGK